MNKTIVKNLLIHDTTSSVFNQGKTAILHLLEKENSDALDIYGNSDNPQATQENIGDAGIWVFTVMYDKACLFCFSIIILNVFQANAPSTYSRKKPAGSLFSGGV